MRPSIKYLSGDAPYEKTFDDDSCEGVQQLVPSWYQGGVEAAWSDSPESLLASDARVPPVRE